MLAERDPRGDRRHDRLERRREADPRSRYETYRGEREGERDDRGDDDDRRDLNVSLCRGLAPRQEPRRPHNAPPDQREPEAPHEKSRRVVRLAEPLTEREVQGEDERVHRGEREAKRVELAQPRVVRAGGEEAPEDRKRR